MDAPTPMLVVGLGNPGLRYEATRHNVGFRAIDLLAARWGVQVDTKRFDARLTRAEVGGRRVWLMKPQTYMNRSGGAVGPMAGFHQLPPSSIVVLHDELDLPVGTVRLKKGGGHGGHNGLRDLHRALPDNGYLRVRIGVGRPPPWVDTAEHVLTPFLEEEMDVIQQSILRAADAVESLLADGLSAAMNHFNRRA